MLTCIALKSEQNPVICFLCFLVLVPGIKLFLAEAVLSPTRFFYYITSVDSGN